MSRATKGRERASHQAIGGNLKRAGGVVNSYGSNPSRSRRVTRWGVAQAWALRAQGHSWHADGRVAREDFRDHRNNQTACPGASTS